MGNAVIFGAGNIGRGFIGQLFAESGLRVDFVDIDRELIDYLNQTGSYHLQAVFNNDTDETTVAPVGGIPADDSAAVQEALTTAAIAATAVGARALKFVAPNLAAGIACRAAAAAPPLNVILCENLKNAAGIVREMVADHVPAAARDYFNTQVGFVDTVIGRMVPPPDPEMRAQDIGLIRVEPYKELPVDADGFKGAVPQIACMTAHHNFRRFTARKLYIHNCGHALLAYRGWLKSHEYGWQALADPEVKEFLFAGWEESAAAVAVEYAADIDWLRRHMQDLFVRFGNRALGDTVFRLGRDPIRKLGPTDRLVAPAKLAAAGGTVPTYLAGGVAAAFCFAPDDDPVARQLQQRLAAEGLPALLQDICDIDPASALGGAVCKQYEKLHNEDNRQ